MDAVTDGTRVAGSAQGADGAGNRCACATRCSSSLVALVAEDLDLKSLLPDDMFAENAERRVKLGLVLAELVGKLELQGGRGQGA